jgi:hypothetical protein
MTNLFRRLREVVGLGLTWGTLWALLGAAIGMVIGIVDPQSIDPGEGPIQAGAIMGMVGLVSGMIFGGILSIADGRRAIRSVPLLRAAMWGVAASAALPLLTPMNNVLLLTTCPLGALSAVVSVMLARGATRGRNRRFGAFL